MTGTSSQDNQIRSSITPIVFIVNARVQSVIGVVMIACIVVIVYSPFVDLPLTDTRADHPVPHAPVLAVSTLTVPGIVQLWFPFTWHAAITLTTDVVAITCAYLC